jgi:poly(ADP-ribose) glycohydrolase ARH3
MKSLEDQFVGCLLGLALGDAVGAPYEGSLVARAAWKVLGVGRGRLLRYTDDTEMAVLLARSLVEHRGVEPDALAREWAHGAHWSRGYGHGARTLLARIRAGEDWRMANRSVFPEGSFGNGAAMRAAPIGLWFHRDAGALVEAATLAASITHAHPLGVEGGVLIARATAMALAGDIDLAALRADCREEAFRTQLAFAEDITMDEEAVVRTLGHSIVAHESVATALHVARRFDAFSPLMDFVISLGGDVDTIGAMAGSLFGARHGVAALPSGLLDRLEDRDSIESTARALYAAWALS